MAFNVIIVGAGIAGLSAAIALRNKGHAITLLEATAELQPIGGVMVLQANANRVLDSIGVYDSLLPMCTAVPCGPSTRRYKDGKFLIQKPVEAHKERYGYPLWPIHRADLQQVLLKAALERGVVVKLGCRVIAIEGDSEIVAVLTKDGEKIEADLLVGADGVESTVRKSIVPDSACVFDSGMDAIRVSIPEAVVRLNSQTSVFMDQVNLWCGPQTTLATMPVRRGDMMLLGIDCCRERKEASLEEKRWTQDVDELREHFKDFDASVQELLSHIKEAYAWRIKEVIPSTWLGENRRIIIIGDAAHSSLPWSGQGGGMALEDAVTLAQCLECAEISKDISEVLKTFQQIRQPRCKRIQEWSAEKGRRATLPDGLQQEYRDANLESHNAWVKSDPWDGFHIDDIPELESPLWKAWLCGHDAVEYANRVLGRRYQTE